MVSFFSNTCISAVCTANAGQNQMWGTIPSEVFKLSDLNVMDLSMWLQVFTCVMCLAM